ncbi:MAG: carboxylesterase, partial [Terrabacter sp.]|nr:carboxylesterase [Terrabacter sp.]
VSVNSVTAGRNADGSVTVRFGGDPGRPNRVAIVDGWNYLVRLYRPRAEVRDGTWSFPKVEPA